MAETERVEVLVLGSGEAGKYLAWHMAESGHRTVVVERRWIGGSCPNVNCLPSKNETESAKVAALVRRAATFGTTVEGARTDMAAVVARKRKMVEGLVAMHRERYRTSGAELVMGTGRFVDAKTIEVSSSDGATRRFTGDRVFLNVGTHASLPAITGLADLAITNIELLELDRLPEHLVVLGGGYVGLEFAQAYRRFGSRVTVVERGPQLLGREDPEIAAALQQLLADEGIEVVSHAELLRVEGRRGALRVVVRSGDGELAIQASDLLAAMGRAPNTAGIGLELAGVELDAHGYVKVNGRLETSAPGVWALGECAGSPQFTHACFDDFRVVRDNLRGGARTTQGRLIPFCLFTDPPLARVGLSELDAQRANVPVRVATLPIASVLRTRTTGETRGFMKAIVAARSDEVLGFAMFGADAGEVVAAVQTAMLARLPYTGLRDAIFTHPTMAEGLNALFAAVRPRSES